MLLRTVRSQSKRAISILPRASILQRPLSISYPRPSAFRNIPLTVFPRPPIPVPQSLDTPTNVLAILGPEMNQNKLVKRIHAFKEEGIEPQRVYYRRQGQVTYVQFKDEDVIANALKFAQTVLGGENGVHIRQIHNSGRFANSTLMIAGPESARVDKLFRNFPVVSVQIRRKMETFAIIIYADVDTAVRAREKLLEAIPCREIVFKEPQDDYTADPDAPMPDNTRTRLPLLDEPTPEDRKTPLLLRTGLSSHFSAPIPENPTPGNRGKPRRRRTGLPSRPSARMPDNRRTSEGSPTTQRSRNPLSPSDTASSNSNFQSQRRRDHSSHPSTSKPDNSHPLPHLDTSPLSREPQPHLNTLQHPTDPLPRLDTPPPTNPNPHPPIQTSHLDTSPPNPQRDRDPLPYLDTLSEAPNTTSSWKPLPPVFLQSGSRIGSQYQPKYQIPGRYRAHLFKR